MSERVFFLVACFQSHPHGVGNSWDKRMRFLGEHPLCDREVVGWIPSRVIPKTLKMVPAALSFGAQH